MGAGGSRCGRRLDRKRLDKKAGEPAQARRRVERDIKTREEMKRISSVYSIINRTRVALKGTPTGAVELREQKAKKRACSSSGRAPQPKREKNRLRGKLKKEHNNGVGEITPAPLPAKLAVALRTSRWSRRVGALVGKKGGSKIAREALMGGC